VTFQVVNELGNIHSEHERREDAEKACAAKNAKDRASMVKLPVPEPVVYFVRPKPERRR
jgi:hypothetical protein